MTTTPDLMTKAAFAAFCNASPSRLSHWIAEGKIGPEALEGSGRTARIRVPVALAQLRARRDIGQSLGNGLAVRLGAPPEPAPAALPLAPAEPAAPPPVAVSTVPPAPEPERPPTRPDLPRSDWLDPVEERIKQEKLEEIARRNRKGAVDEAAQAGRFMETAAARREMGRIADGMLQVLDQSLTTIATALAEHFKVPQRDVLHLLKREFRGVRERAADTLARQAADLPRLLDADLPADAEPAAPDPE